MAMRTAARSLVPRALPRRSLPVRSLPRRRLLSATPKPTPTPTPTPTPKPKPKPAATPKPAPVNTKRHFLWSDVWTMAAGRGPTSWKMAAVVLGLGGAVTVAWQVRNAREFERKFRSVGKAALGGPFELHGVDGELVKSSDFHGQWVLLYFGFTTCPDICPAELTKIAHALDTLDGQWSTSSWPVRPVMITVDPKRDTPELMAAYCEKFHPRMVGLLGTEKEIEAAARQYRVYYHPTNEDDDSYLVDHSVITYLVNPDGEFVAFYGQNASWQEMARKIGDQVWQWRKTAALKAMGFST